MTTFDTTGLPDAQPPGWGAPQPSPGGMMPTDQPPVDSPNDSLALLRAAVADQTEIEPIVIPVGKTGVRLVCHTDITSKQLSTWQNRAIPLHLRKSGKAAPTDVDQMQLAVAVLVGTLLRIEVADPRRRGEWMAVEDARTGEALTFNDMPVLTMFSAMDTMTALKRLFGRDSGVVKAGRMVLGAAGWNDDELVGYDEDAELDPT